MVELLTRLEKVTNAWDASVVRDRDRSRVDARTAAAVAGHALALAGSPMRAPVVLQVGRDDAGYVPGALAWVTADGLHMALQYPAVPTTTVLHEVAHLLTEDPLDRLELRRLNERTMHGPLWLQNYLWLLGRLMGPGYNPFYLRSTMPPELCPAAIPLHPCVWGVQRVDLT